ncbi:MAG: glycosyl transferase [Muribaculaceae bacterium]|nr:glycosyl transferase [Muribaculaceae bacterium]
MIPKKIHYCWFGGNPLPDSALNCINSWKKLCPDYEIKEWNESNFDLDTFPYARQAYDTRKFAFVTDIVRLYALYTEGGIYMDTDVELLKPLDSILNFKAISGFETTNMVPTGLMASEKNIPIIKELLSDYKERLFVKENGSLETTTNVIYITECLKKYGLQLNNQKQTIAEFTFLPSEYFCPKSVKDGKIYLTPKTIAIHHFAGTWHPKWRNKARSIILKIGGYPLKSFLRYFIPKKILRK